MPTKLEKMREMEREAFRSEVLSESPLETGSEAAFRLNLRNLSPRLLDLWEAAIESRRLESSGHHTDGTLVTYDQRKAAREKIDGILAALEK